MAKKYNMKTKKSSNIGINLGIEKILTIFLAFIICLGLYINGYFFEQQGLSINIITTLVFLSLIFSYIKTKENTFYLDKKYFILGSSFLVINILGLFVASNLRDALQNVLILTNALMIFLIALQAFKEESNILIFLKGLYWIISSISILSILAYILGTNLLGFYPNNSYRLFGTLGYPNTMAVVFITAIFIGMYLIDFNKNKTYIYLFANSLLFISLLKTQSRGALVILPVLLAAYFIFLPKNKKSSTNLILIIFLSTFSYLLAFNDRVLETNSTRILLSLSVIVALGTIYYFWEKIKTVKFKNTKLISIILITILILGTLTFIIYNKETILQSTIVKRIERIGNFEKDSSMYSRVIFMKDALEIAKDNLLLGTGAGGWNAEYRKYRSYLYYTSQVHNHYLQVLVETGLLGFILFIALWVLLLYKLLKNWQKNINKRNYYTLLLIIAISFMLHSFFDFDFTYPAIYWIWWILFTLSINYDSLETIKIDSAKNFTLKTVSIIIVFVLIINSSLWLGSAFGKSGINFIKRNDLNHAIRKLELSKIFDPVNPTYLVNLSQLYFAKGEKEKALETLNQAIKYNPTNFEWHIVKTRFLVEMDRYDEAYESALKAIERAPFEEIVYYDTARFFIQKEEDNEALKYAEKILNIAEKEGEAIQQNPYVNWWKGIRIDRSGKLALLKGQILEKQGDYDKAGIVYYLAINEINDKQKQKEIKEKIKKLYENQNNYIINGNFTNGFLGWNLNGNGGEKRELVKLNNENYINISKKAIDTKWWGINQLIYEFEPNQEYQISFKAFSKSNNGIIRLILHQVGSDGGNPQKTKTIELTEKIKEYNWSFKTDDFKNKESLRIHFLVPNTPEEQDLYIGEIKLKKIKK